MENKKGVTAVIGTILLILMTIAAVGIIWGVVMPMVKQGAQEASVSCIGADLSVIKTGGITCYNNNTNTTKVVIGRGAKELLLKDVMIRLQYADGSTDVRYVGDDKLGVLPGQNEQESYNITNINVTPSKVAAAPELESETGEITKLCDVTSEVLIEEC